ncbi:Nin one binding Zn-ribbon like-domain-containing protein [Calycina marina]|uniref:20S-pre-rRNA D-site endonuclease NOB1 n=1 Tax=Calycina marina TaxID=1763456 RepID=A0A9P7YWL4_9HELO|nr:Nin one binding Zn-ribbon like-domain-containing protein [Calycina marina]
MAVNTPKPIHSLIIDAGPIIKNAPSISTLLGQAEHVFTIPAVVEEIRDPATRLRMETTLLPFLKLRSPRSASIKIITDFARRTGDLEVLSRPDIHLMALAYELECERNHGDWRLRTIPGQKRLNGPLPVSLQEAGPGPIQVSMPVDSTESAQPAVMSETRGAWGTVVPQPSSDPDTIVESLESTHISDEQISESSPTEDLPTETTTEPAASDELEDTDNPETVEDYESDGEGWITPSNLKEHLSKDQNGEPVPEEEVKIMQVALITSDFAMQNVLLRMNLNLLSPSLQRIRQLKTWILRCHACFDTTKDMSKQFCPKCGKDTLLRVSCSVDKDGKFKLHLKKNMQWSSRGNVYSIPKPVAGTSSGKKVVGGGKNGWGQNLILAEDQKEYINAMTSSRRKKERDLMDEDYLPGLLSGDRGRAGGRTKVGAGRNVNSRKRI